MDQNYVDVISSLDGTTVIHISDFSQDGKDLQPSKQEHMKKILHTIGSAVFHTTYGNGQVMAVSDDIVTIHFEDGVSKCFSINLCLKKDYLQPYIPSEKQSKKWFASIKWTKDCLDCQKKHNGYCHRPSCAQMEYDEWGDPIPLYCYFADGNNVAEYLEKKRKRKEAERQSLRNHE